LNLIGILVDLTTAYKEETLVEKQDVDSFYAASVARTELIMLASSHPNVLEYLEKQKKERKKKDDLEAISGVLNVVYKINK
jgi:hypothetical protein